MKIEVVVCDRCGEDIGQVGKKIPVVNVRVQRKDEVSVRELCLTCGSALKTFLASPQKEEKRPENVDAVLMEQLSEIRRTAAQGLERYADGASPDELAQHLRDVSSGARRR